VRDIDPIIVLSAAPRMGTTLVQRLLCSAADCLIYGDTIGNDAAFLISYLASKELAIRNQAFHSDPMLAPVLAGDVSEFIADLSPASAGYLDSLSRSMAGPLEHCRNEARNHGRPHWGWKLAGAQTWMIRMLPAMLPKARIIHVDRDLVDTVRSAKTAGMVGEGPDFERFVADAAANRRALAELNGLPVLHLRLEELLADPETGLGRLEEFAGISPIDRSVLAVKVNQPHSPWIAPVEISAAEEAVIRRYEPSNHHECAC
jgi:hypothetical protein